MTDSGDTDVSHAGLDHPVPAGKIATAVLHVGGLNWASEKAVVEQVLGRSAGGPTRAEGPPPAGR